MSLAGEKDRKRENETSRLIKGFTDPSPGSPPQNPFSKQGKGRLGRYKFPPIGRRVRIMYSSQCSSGFGEAIMYSSHMSTSSNSYEQQLEDLGKKCLTIDKRLNELETKLVELVGDKSHLVKQRRRLQYSTNESWSQIIAYSTTFHGLKEVLTEKNRFLKALWWTIFASAVAASIYYNVTVAREYLNDPTATQVRIIRMERYDFPVMLLCPDTWLDADKALSSGLSVLALKYSLTYLINYAVTPSAYFFQSDREYAQAAFEFHEWYYNESNVTDLADFFKFVALDSDQFIVKCSYCNGSGDAASLNTRFTKIVMNSAVCYNLSLESTDGRVALSDLDFLVVSVPDKTMGLLRSQTYWRLFVNPDLSIGMSDTHYVQTFPHHSNTIRVMPRRFKSAALKSSDCCPPEKASALNYTQATCVADCVSKSELLAQTEPTCTPLILHRADSIPYNFSNMCQSYPMWPPERTLAARLVATPTKCIEDCPPLCDKWIYDVTVEAHSIVDNQSLKNLPKGTVADAFNGMQGLTRFYFLNEIIHYGGVLLFEEVPTYSFETMISNFGGQMGLWLGASLMSVIQLLMLFTNICVERRKERQRKSTKS